MQSFKDSSSALISFEGIEGSGKTTQIQKIKAYLTDQGFTVSVFREPGGTKFGEGLRNVILSCDASINPLSEALLFASSRAQLLNELIIPRLLQKRNIVILDRYIDSSFAYQGYARGLGIDTIKNIHTHFPLSIMPDISFYLKIDLETSYARQQKRGATKDYFEKENHDFYQKLLDGFDECYKIFPERINIIDAQKSVDEVFVQITEPLNKLFADG